MWVTWAALLVGAVVGLGAGMVYLNSEKYNYGSWRSFFSDYSEISLKFVVVYLLTFSVTLLIATITCCTVLSYSKNKPENRTIEESTHKTVYQADDKFFIISKYSDEHNNRKIIQVNVKSTNEVVLEQLIKIKAFGGLIFDTERVVVVENSDKVEK